MTRPIDWDFSKISGTGETLARSGPLRGEMPAFASHIEERSPHPGEALPWAEIEFERISKSPRRAKDGAQPSAVATKRRFPRIRFRHAVRLPLFRLPRLALPRITLPHMPRPAMPSISLPCLSLPHISVPRMTLPSIRLPRIARPAMPRVSLPRLSAPRLAMPKVALPRLRASARRGWRAAAFGFHFAAVAVIWLSAEAVYLLRLGYAHMRLALLRLALEMEDRGTGWFSGVDLWPLARQAAAIAFFIAVGYGAAVIVGPVLKDGNARLAVLSPSPTHTAVHPIKPNPSPRSMLRCRCPCRALRMCRWA